MNRSRLAALSAGAMFLVASVLVPATALAAGTGTVTLSPSTVGTSTGSTFFVDIVSQSSVLQGGASASINFDQAKVQILSVAKPALGTGWNVAGASYVLPTVAQIGSANNSATGGHLSAIGAFFADGTSSVPAASQVLARVTFFATAAGSPTISLPTGGSDGAAILDGTAATYGSPVAITTTGSAVTITAGTGGGGASTTTDVTGTVDAGYVALTCPSAITVPLARNAENVANFACAVGSNVTWSLSTLDNNSDPSTHGYMRDTVQNVHLHDSAHIKWNGHLDASNNLVYDGDVNLVVPTAQVVASGAANVAVPLTFSQYVEPNDVAGNYAMSVQFSVVSSF